MKFKNVNNVRFRQLCRSEELKLEWNLLNFFLSATFENLYPFFLGCHCGIVATLSATALQGIQHGPGGGRIRPPYSFGKNGPLQIFIDSFLEIIVESLFVFSLVIEVIIHNFCNFFCVAKKKSKLAHAAKIAASCVFWKFCTCTRKTCGCCQKVPPKLVVTHDSMIYFLFVIAIDAEHFGGKTQSTHIHTRNTFCSTKHKAAGKENRVEGARYASAGMVGSTGVTVISEKITFLVNCLKPFWYENGFRKKWWGNNPSSTLKKWVHNFQKKARNWLTWIPMPGTISKFFDYGRNP